MFIGLRRKFTVVFKFSKLLAVHTNPFTRKISPSWLPPGISLFIRREDVIHPVVSGNKWRKLEFNLREAVARGAKTLVTFGGAYSNHIYATAAAARESGFDSVGIIRGESSSASNPTLTFARKAGMQLIFVDRNAYRDKDALVREYSSRFKSPYVIPEGGTNCLALKGFRSVMDEEISGMDVLVVPVGTGGTMAGLIAAAPKHMQILGVSVLKGSFHQEDIRNLLGECRADVKASWQVDTEGHCGGYAKISDELIDFIYEFKEEQDVLLDPVYTGKMLLRVKKLIIEGYFEEGTRLCVMHTGGLQGWNGIRERYGISPP